MPANNEEARKNGHKRRQSYHHRNRRVVIPDGVMAVGLIVGAHGLGGEVKVELHTDFPERFVTDRVLLLGSDLHEVRIVSARPHQAFYLIRFEGVTSRSDTDSLRGEWLFIRDEEAVLLDDETFWIHDIIGMVVQDIGGRRLGTVRNILQTGANDVYLIQPAEGVNGGRDILLPAIPDVIKHVDLANRVIEVDLIPGLLDDDRVVHDRAPAAEHTGGHVRTV